jgi:hypothetical protein
VENTINPTTGHIVKLVELESTNNSAVAWYPIKATPIDVNNALNAEKTTKKTVFVGLKA